MGDLIICRRNDHAVEAGESGRALANGDVLRIEAIIDNGVMVRRLLDSDPATGQPPKPPATRHRYTPSLLEPS